MPSKIGLVSRDFLENAPLPKHGSTYTVISHKFVIDTVKEELNDRGFFIEEESYRATTDAAIATGVYKLTYKADPELSMAFAWTNSYNKQVKFKAVVGAISNVNGAFMILGEQGSWVRKHTGTADKEAKEQIINQVKNAGKYYKQLLADRDTMKSMSLTKRKQSELLGILFADYAILEVTSANAVKQQMNKPPFIYSGGNETLWSFYNHTIYSIQDNHPKTWLEEQRMIHYIITNEFNMLPVPEVMDPLPESEPEKETSTDSNQLDLEQVINEIESEEEFKNQPIADENLESIAKDHQEISEEELAEQLYSVDNNPELSAESQDKDFVDKKVEESTEQIEQLLEDSQQNEEYEKIVEEKEESSNDKTAPCVAHELENLKDEEIEEELEEPEDKGEDCSENELLEISEDEEEDDDDYKFL